MRGEDFFRRLECNRQSLRRFLAAIDVPQCKPHAPFYCPLPRHGRVEACPHGRKVKEHSYSLAQWARWVRLAYPGLYHHSANADAATGPDCPGPAVTEKPWYLAEEVAQVLDDWLDIRISLTFLAEMESRFRGYVAEVYAWREANGLALFNDDDWWSMRGRQGKSFVELLDEAGIRVEVDHEGKIDPR
jgi:hypothetical protein